jgi:HSP20 family protein
LVTTQDRLNRLFNSTLGNTLQDWGEEGQLASSTWAPPVDIYETDHNLVIKAELPGVDPREVEVRVEDNTLYLKGQRKLQEEVRQDNYHRIERTYGTFTRSFTLPGSVNADKVVAEYKDGVLALTMPKREEAKPKTIKIYTGGEEPQQKLVGAAART